MLLDKRVRKGILGVNSEDEKKVVRAFVEANKENALVRWLVQRFPEQTCSQRAAVRGGALRG